MSEVIDIRTTDEPRDVIHRLVHRLTEGKLVAFPTETVYLVGTSALHPDGVRELQSVLDSNRSPALPLLLKTREEVYDYSPKISKLGQKLARRCWPGPVTIAFEAAPAEGLLTALPPETLRAVVVDGRVMLRVSAHPIVQQVLSLTPMPLVVSSERNGQKPMPGTASEVIEQFGSGVTLVVDDGPCRYGEPATVIEVSGKSWRILEPGVVSRTMLSRLASDMYLFICTGNTCRSPMAEGLFRKLLAERLQCSEDELADHGFLIASAGLAATDGLPASPEAVDLLSRKGIDLRSHSSQPLTDRLVEQADRIFTMTGEHRESIVVYWPEAAERVELLSRDRTDITDPIGGGMQDYELCEREIEENVRAILAELYRDSS